MSESATASAPAKTQPKAKKNRLSSGFFRFVLTRFLLIIPTVFILVTIVFFVMRATGDPISAAMGGRLTPEELQRRIHAAGYDRPLVVQYLDYLGGLLRGESGHHAHRQPAGHHHPDPLRGGHVRALRS